MRDRSLGNKTMKCVQPELGFREKVLFPFGRGTYQ